MTTSESKRINIGGNDQENASGIPGSTRVEDDVIAAIAGHVARQVPGVVRLGGSGVVRSVTGMVDSGSSSRARGVTVEAGRREAIFDIDLVVQYGYKIPEMVEEIRRSVSSEIKEQVGLTSKEINVNVVAIDFPDSDDDDTDERRVE